jgi:hypothetical protein
MRGGPGGYAGPFFVCGTDDAFAAGGPAATQQKKPDPARALRLDRYETLHKLRFVQP